MSVGRVLYCPPVVRLHRGRPCRWLPRRPQTYVMRWRHVALLLRWQPYVGIWIASWRVSSDPWTWDAHVGIWFERPEMKRRSAKSGPSADKHLASLENNVFHGLLPLVEHCALRQYDDGEAREPGWFTVGTSGAAWSVTVKDPDACVSFRTVADTLDKALETAALLLSCDEAPWEHDRFLADAAKRRKK